MLNVIAKTFLVGTQFAIATELILLVQQLLKDLCSIAKTMPPGIRCR
jgi:hypothetical protein